MPKAPKADSAAEPEITQDEPTKVWPLDDAGRPLDRHNLPINGPARAKALVEQGIEDPAIAEEASAPVSSEELPPPPPPPGDPDGSGGQSEQG